MGASVWGQRIDRAIETIAPQWAYKRAQDRLKLKALHGATAYKGAAFNRRPTAFWPAAQLAPDEEVSDMERGALVARSNDLYRNHPMAHGAISRQVINTVGASGLKPKSKVDWAGLGMSQDEAQELQKTAEREWRIFSANCDLARTLSMRGLQELVLKGALVSGDVFVSTPSVQYTGNVYSTKLQVIEGARVSNPGFTSDSEKMRQGVEYGDNGEPSRYHVLGHFPGYLLPGQQSINNWEALNAFGSVTGLRRVMHVYIKERDGQSRGLPILTPIIEPLKQLDRYRDAELMAAVVSGMFTVFVKTEQDSLLEDNIPDRDKVGEVEPGSEPSQEYHMGDGAINYLRTNESIETANPGRPNTAYEPFIMAVYKEIGAALGVPLEELLLFYQSSFSAARASILQAWRLYLTRREWLAEMFLNHVWQLFWEEAVALGRLKVTGWNDPARRALYTCVSWIGPTRGHIDPLKAVQSSALMVKEGFSSPDVETAELKGMDATDVLEQIIAINKKREAAGLAPIGVTVNTSRR